MPTAEQKLFPDGIPAYLNLSAFAKLLGVSRTQAMHIVNSRPASRPRDCSPRAACMFIFHRIRKQRRKLGAGMENL